MLIHENFNFYFRNINFSLITHVLWMRIKYLTHVNPKQVTWEEWTKVLLNVEIYLRNLSFFYFNIIRNYLKIVNFVRNFRSNCRNNKNLQFKEKDYLKGTINILLIININSVCPNVSSVSYDVNLFIKNYFDKSNNE